MNAWYTKTFSFEVNTFTISRERLAGVAFLILRGPPARAYHNTCAFILMKHINLLEPNFERVVISMCGIVLARSLIAGLGPL